MIIKAKCILCKEKFEMKVSDAFKGKLDICDGCRRTRFPNNSTTMSKRD